MMWNAKKGTPAPPKAKAKEKAKKAKKIVLKSIHSHKKKKICTSPTFRWPKMLRLWRQPKETKQAGPLRVYQVSHNHRVSLKKTEDNNTLVFIVDVKANKYHIKQAM
ncbi:large ribosomal subunit protein uL23-like [Thomomys bottae]